MDLSNRALAADNQRTGQRGAGGRFLVVQAWSDGRCCCSSPLLVATALRRSSSSRSNPFMKRITWCRSPCSGRIRMGRAWIGFGDCSGRIDAPLGPISFALNSCSGKQNPHCLSATTPSMRIRMPRTMRDRNQIARGLFRAAHASGLVGVLNNNGWRVVLIVGALALAPKRAGWSGPRPCRVRCPHRLAKFWRLEVGDPALSCVSSSPTRDGGPVAVSRTALGCGDRASLTGLQSRAMSSRSALEYSQDSANRRRGAAPEFRTAVPYRVMPPPPLAGLGPVSSVNCEARKIAPQLAMRGRDHFVAVELTP